MTTKNLLENIFNKKFENANQLFSESIQNIVEKKFKEVKKIIAAEGTKSKSIPDRTLPFEPNMKAPVKRIKGATVQIKPDRPQLKPLRKVFEDEADKPEATMTVDAHGDVVGTEAINSAKKEVVKKLLAKDNSEIKENKQLDEISKELAANAAKKAMYDMKGMGRGQGGPTASEREHNAKRRQLMSKAIDKLSGAAKVKATDK